MAKVAQLEKPFRNRIVGAGMMDTDQFLAAPGNWRLHPDHQQQALAGAIDQVGFIRSILVNKLSGTVIDGHLRVTLALRSGVKSLPVEYVELTDDEEKLALLTLDPIASMAAADKDKLEELLHSVQSDDERVSRMLTELAAREGLAYGDEPKDAEPQFDRAAELLEKWGVEYGSLWKIANHRLLCGDSTVRADVERVMSGERAICVFADPPYGVSIGEKNRFLNSFQPAERNLENIRADDADEADLKKMLLCAFSLTREVVMADDCSIFVCAPQGGSLGLMMMMMREAGLPIRHIINWVKNQPTFSLGRLDYEYQHEPILFTWKKTHKRINGGQFHTSIWAIDKPRASPDHPTIKPIELPANAIANHTEPGDLIYDPFCGSGTTLVACQNLNRKGRAIEIEPKYVAVCLQRMQDAFPGIQIERLT